MVRVDRADILFGMVRGVRRLLLAGVVAMLVVTVCPHALGQQSLPAEPMPQTAWEQRLDAKYAALIQMNGDGRDAALSARLLRLRDIDQDIRNRLMLNQNINTLPESERKRLTDEMVATDEALTTELKSIVAERGWPTIARVGLDASKAAALLLTHSQDHAWQKSLLPQLERLVASNKIAGDDVALIVDKTLKADGRPQRFGTQFDFKDGGMVMWPVEAPGQLSARRERYLLPPMEDYKILLGQMYHMKVR